MVGMIIVVLEKLENFITAEAGNYQTKLLHISDNIGVEQSLISEENYTEKRHCNSMKLSLNKKWGNQVDNIDMQAVLEFPDFFFLCI